MSISGVHVSASLEQVGSEGGFVAADRVAIAPSDGFEEISKGVTASGWHFCKACAGSAGRE